MNKKGLSIAIIIVIIIICSIALFIAHIIHVRNKIGQSIQDLSKIDIKKYQENHTKGDFPDEMKDFLSTSTVNLFDYCFSHPNDFRDKAKLCKHYEGVLLYQNVNLSRYKKDLLPKIKQLVGKYTEPECFRETYDSTRQKDLPYSPDLKQFQNTLIEWCLIANCFEEKDDGNSAFLLSYAAARLSIKLLTDYADGASEENLKTVNNILRCASCQLIYIANSGLKHNRNMVRAIAKDLYTISKKYPPFSRTIKYDLDIFDNALQKVSKQGNYALSQISKNDEGINEISNELKNRFRQLFVSCDLPYYKSHEDIVSWDKELRTKAKEAVDKLDRRDLPQLISYAVINNNLPDYDKLKLITDETSVIIDGAATVLATYEYISKFTGSFKYSPSTIVHDVNSLVPESKLSGLPIGIELPGSSFNGYLNNNIGVVCYSDHETMIKSTKYGYATTQQIKNNFGIVFLTKEEFELQILREEYKANYFDLDEALSKMTPEQKSNYENALLENEKMKKDAEERADKLIAKYKKDKVEVESIDDFLCGYKLGEIAKNVKDSCYNQTDLFGLTFGVKSKKPFLDEFYGALVFVDDSKKIKMINFSNSYDTTSKRETSFFHIKTAIEAMEGIKSVKNTSNYKEEIIEYLREKDNCVITLSLLKGLDGGGTITLYASRK